MAEREEVRDELANLKSDMAELRTHLVELAEGVRDAAHRESVEAKERLEVEARTMAGRMESLLDRARSKGQQAIDVMERQIEERPVTSMLAAFGVGMLLGKLLTRR